MSTILEKRDEIYKRLIKDLSAYNLSYNGEFFKYENRTFMYFRKCSWRHGSFGPCFNGKWYFLIDFFKYSKREKRIYSDKDYCLQYTTLDYEKLKQKVFDSIYSRFKAEKDQKEHEVMLKIKNLKKLNKKKK